MPRWLSRALARIHAHVLARTTHLTFKARQEAAVLGFSSEDVRLVLADLSASDPAERLISHITGDWIYVFRPVVAGRAIYVKIAFRGAALVLVSFHEEASDADA